LFDLAQAEYWIGDVALRQGRHEDAGEWLRQYRDSAIRLAALDPSNFDWQKEQAYGHHNLAVLDESLGRYAEAERAMSAEAALYRQWLRERPKDLELRFEAANVSSWLGSLAMRQGRLADAESYFAEQAEAMRRSAAEEPRNVRWQEYLLDALLLLADAQAQRGRLEEVGANVTHASAIAEALSAQDPANNYWRLSLGRVRVWQAQLGAMPPSAASSALAAEAAAVLGAAYSAEPRNRHVLNWLLRARHVQADLALSQGDLDRARGHLVEARALVEPAWRLEPSEVLRIWLARTRVLQGEIGLRGGVREGSTDALAEARDLLLTDAAPEVPFARLDPLVRALHLLDRPAEAVPYIQRLERAGYVPLRPFPDGAQTAGQ
jgi:tetratricopeptide (TPR) repeat protein